VKLKSKRLAKDGDLVEVLNVTPRWVRSYRKEIPHLRFGKAYRYDLESPEFKAWLEKQKAGAQ
jgi:hypothetical protein